MDGGSSPPSRLKVVIQTRRSTRRSLSTSDLHPLNYPGLPALPPSSHATVDRRSLPLRPDVAGLYPRRLPDGPRPPLEHRSHHERRPACFQTLRRSNFLYHQRSHLRCISPRFLGPDFLLYRPDPAGNRISHVDPVRHSICCLYLWHHSSPSQYCVG